MKVPDEAAAPRWNTKDLAWRLAADAAGAACAGVLVAPLISMIDRSIMEHASGRSSLVDSIRASARALTLRPAAALLSRPCALVFALYGGTYLTANALDTAASTVNDTPAATTSSGAAKFAASSAANVGLCMYKDRSFVRMFGPVGAAPRAVPLPSYALFTLRDCLTVFASFNIPPLLAPLIDPRLSAPLRRWASGQTAAQFVAPAAVQLLSTPLHLLGLDLYNRPARSAAVSWRDRFELVRSNWLISSAARVCRILPAFGVGGVVNFKVRQSLMASLD
ncbi:uncharacterized protein MAM_05120 [Metarhizium album ARSEF 1941]|uniref:Sequence orphan n=1 Tax=Metarhizium album (strain ARSEF 1941) TaxID=1081103 RepID=A0A0B2WLS8_METAS|nr:uncharacterized protein MAM_05120 [Metarhizium album ARSEF 1941]KHN97011.1 hypothetical protein MAM_05120 [Metarhizium album ARSEF 1941]